jgi:hypothetical protein
MLSEEQEPILLNARIQQAEWRNSLNKRCHRDSSSRNGNP